MAKWLLCIFLICLFSSSSEGQDYPSDGQSMENFLADKITELSVAKQVGDTSTVVNILANLAISFQSARMHERSREYLLEGVQYAIASKNDTIINSIAGQAGYSLMAQMKRPFYEKARDSAIWWFKKKIELSEKVYGKYSSEAGWGYNGVINVHYQHAKSANFFDDSTHYYYEEAARRAKDSYWLMLGTKQIYAHYLMIQGKIEEALQLFEDDQVFLDSLNKKAQHGYYSLLLKLIASKHNLDTLSVLYDSALTTFAHVVAATHEEKLYQNDQKYEVSKTKETLGQTEAQLSASRQLLITLAVAILVFIGLSLYLYLLFQKNRKLRDLNANLVKEQNHRVKNNLQMLASMIAVQAEKVEDETVRQNLLDNEKRIQSLALLHRRLYDRQYIKVDVKEYFEELVEELLFSLSAQQVQVKLEIEKVTLPVDTMVHLGLITNELVTNSVKHGFKGEHNNPEIMLSLKKIEDQFTLSYLDNGLGYDKNAKEGFGTDLIKSQVKQLNGKYLVLNGPGFVHQISFNI